MSSLEIAELTGKRHDHVLADIRKLLMELRKTSPEYSGHVPDSYGRPGSSSTSPSVRR
ncbi:Rha family transcriptional regulator [Xanthobacter versatilis]|uniref:Rha family transcriptional regulator n=1 Tax=Xanthobacter autotrophicus (strain ATCC BAA-1158 / Py2) TaxID=78245 RepID=UPI00372B0073